MSRTSCRKCICLQHVSPTIGRPLYKLPDFPHSLYQRTPKKSRGRSDARMGSTHITEHVGQVTDSHSMSLTHPWTDLNISLDIL